MSTPSERAHYRYLEFDVDPPSRPGAVMRGVLFAVVPFWLLFAAAVFLAVLISTS